ncbi:putative nucleoporin nup44 protein [Zalerion maritima]|uniref:Nucleoporin nup44 protein n=1 Tax=Zalerion maritima TaxID=339359 RepID=A0AAD5RHF5_9PEZI|nr:putative nucleoporin nup44 protein [Zalerion maritima]
MSVFGKPVGTLSVFGGGSSAPFGQLTTNNAAPNTNSLFGQSQQQQQQQQQQPQQQPGSMLNQSILGQSQVGAYPMASTRLWQPGSMTPHQKSVTDQMQVIMNKWDPASPNCVFKHYFYNKVEESQIPFYAPGPHEDPKEWDEALQHKPAPGFVPVLAQGFEAMAERLKVQRRAVAEFNARLHEINKSLDAMLSRHDLETSVRTLACRRRHVVLKERCLALAAKVQVLRNRGYALSADEDELRLKLASLERGLGDPALNARAEELWSRLIASRQLADRLRQEMSKNGGIEGEGLGEEVEAKAKKILEDYEKQLQHLKKETDSIKKDFEGWEKEQEGSR